MNQVEFREKQVQFMEQAVKSFEDIVSLLKMIHNISDDTDIPKVEEMKEKEIKSERSVEEENEEDKPKITRKKVIKK